MRRTGSNRESVKTDQFASLLIFFFKFRLNFYSMSRHQKSISRHSLKIYKLPIRRFGPVLIPIKSRYAFWPQSASGSDQTDRPSGYNNQACKLLEAGRLVDMGGYKEIEKPKKKSWSIIFRPLIPLFLAPPSLALIHILPCVVGATPALLWPLFMLVPPSSHFHSGSYYYF